MSDSCSALTLEQLGEDGSTDPIAWGKALDAWCEPACWRCSPPFLVGWYNELRGETAGGSQRIDAADTAVAFGFYSVPGFLDVVVEHFARAKPSTNFVDSATNEILDSIRRHLPSGLDALLVNTDDGPPYYHVQTVGAVAGVDQHIEPAELQEDGDDAWREELSDRLEDKRDPKMWGTDPEMRRKIFGLNVHPVWGGWYAYRALLVFRGLTCDTLARPPPLNVLASGDVRRVISEYNLKHEECYWRDLSEEGHPPERRYNPEEYFFFMETKSGVRRRFLELKAASYTLVPAPRLS